MNSNKFRVIAPPVNRKKMSRQFELDMLESALEVRNVLYDIPQAIGLQKVLMVLDFPHFIPIENTDDALYQEFERLQQVLAWTDVGANDFDEAEYEKVLGKVYDIEHELTRREDFASDDCANHFAGGWYLTTDGKKFMAVPPHMGVDADRACPKCQGWLNYPSNFFQWLGGE